MQMIKRFILSFLLILTLLPMTGMAGELDEHYFDDVMPGVNKVVVVTACDDVLVITASIFDGPVELQGKVFILSWEEGKDAKYNKQVMRGYIQSLMNDLKPLIRFVRLEQMGVWRCA